mgnify:CR=1 FL=1
MGCILKVATRKSELALAQTRMVENALLALDSNIQFEEVSMTTEGDRRLDKSLSSFGGKGVFIKELEVSLLEGRADFAVHSLKDMPAEPLKEFKIASVLKREDPRDVFISKNGVLFKNLPPHSRVGTGSIRRIVQLKAIRNDLEYVPIRGNLQTRLKKLEELDGIVLAAAGMKRLGLESKITEYFDPSEMLPASGQGIVAIETLKNCSDAITQKLNAINDPATFILAVAEMAYLKTLNAGCQFPVAAFAQIEGALKIRGIYYGEVGCEMKKAECEVDLPCDVNSDDYQLRQDLLETARQLGVRLANLIKAALTQRQ